MQYSFHTTDYCHRAGRDCNGRDIRHLKANRQQCMAACNSDCRCKSIQNNRGNCWLKKHACLERELNVIAYGNDYVKKGA